MASAPMVLAHAANSPGLLIGGPLLVLAVFVVLEVRARKQEREQDPPVDEG